MRVHLQPRSTALLATAAQGGSASLTVGMVASLLSFTGLTMDHDSNNHNTVIAGDSNNMVLNAVNNNRSSGSGFIDPVPAVSHVDPDWVV